MATFKTLKETFLLARPDAASERLARIPSGTTFTGEREGNFIRARIPGLSPREGFVPLMDVSAIDGRPAGEAAVRPALTVDELARLRRAARSIPARRVTKPIDTSTLESYRPSAAPGGGSGTGRGTSDGMSPRTAAFDRRTGTGGVQERDASPPSAPVQAQPVDFSTFSPASVARGGVAIIQVFLHRSEQAAEAAALARESDPQATRRGVATLDIDVAIGQRIDIVLEVNGATIDKPAQYLVWRGEPRACQFLLSVPAGEQRTALTVRAIVSVNGAPAGSLLFQLPVAAQVSAADAATGIRGDAARHFGRAFLSYASEDRAEVLKRAQALKALRIEFFQDLLSLEPGERWKKRLYDEIDTCDVFLVFWSSHAAQSKWVIAETERALARHRGDDSAPPDIVPIVLEGPPVPDRPASLQAIQMDDWLRYVLAAVEAAPPQSPGTRP